MTDLFEGEHGRETKAALEHVVPVTRDPLLRSSGGRAGEGSA